MFSTGASFGASFGVSFDTQNETAADCPQVQDPVPTGTRLHPQNETEQTEFS
jgi:hypothetical protein